MRPIFVRLHRWLGLATALFLAIAGLTGAVIAFNHELDEWLNPELFRVDDRGATIPALELAARVEAIEPRLRVSYVPLEPEPGHALVLGVIGRADPVTGALYDVDYTEVFLNPVTGAWLGERLWGACCLERRHIIPFIYLLHYTLHLPETWGLWVMGSIAMAWAIDSFVGFYLTLPVRRRSRRAAERRAIEGQTFWQRWRPAWRIKLGASPYRVNFDLHRAAGLWFWGVLLMLAVSGLSLNLHFEIFRPVLSLVAPLTPSPFDPSRMMAPIDPLVPYEVIVDTARQAGAQRGWKPPFDVFYSQEYGLYGVGFGDHHAPGIGVPFLYFNRDGSIAGDVIPGSGTAGDVVAQAMFPLHSGQIAGLAGRIVICLTGLAVAALSITGVVIWAKKRKGRRAFETRASIHIRDENQQLSVLSIQKKTLL